MRCPVPAAHNYANGVNISGTEVDFGGQVVAKHPRFDYQLEDDNWRDLLAKIIRQDVD